ncbi:coiled-coil domain-containing protein [Allosphingosinicella deserti]|uniref:ATPase n=1 Tax=Allosphingosinicella deserti TaxID=2116704 RepID=A0A2P7QP96_9SPHN|nr:hypothetical protein [Sphingomonas deserti]PSJ39795.1 hypothetical protein C7I55_14570 [Sphingomonas deserti]
MTGADRAETQPEGGAHEIHETGAERADADWIGAAGVTGEDVAELPAEQPGRQLFGALLLLLAFAWVAVAGWSLLDARPAVGLQTIVSAIATISAPLVLLALLWIWLGRTPRREAERFGRAVSTMRAESTALESVLSIVSTRIEENHARLRGEAERLMSLGDEASDRLGRVTHYLSKETAALDRKAAALDAAATSAKVDIGVLLHDLPRAEAQARGVAEAMKDAGITAHSQAGALEAQLAALSARGREADDILGGAAQRLSAHVARIESSSTAAAESIAEAATGMTASVDSAMTRATEALDAARAALDAQGVAVLATITQTQAALDRAGEDATRNLSQRLDQLSRKVEGLAGHLSAQDAASHALVTGLAKELAELDDWFAQLGRTGGAESEKLGAAVQAVRDSTRELITELGAGKISSESLIGSARDMSEMLTGVARQLGEDLPAALARVEDQAGRTREAAIALAPIVATVQSSATAAAERVETAEAAVARQRDALESLLARIDEGTSGGEQKLAALGAAAAQAREAASRIAAETGPELVEAMLRVRETANQAAERAREAIASVIPASAEALGDAGRQALTDAIAATVERQMAELALVSERAVASARTASERLTRQMLVLGETAAAVEERIQDGRKEREDQESENFSRRVALLIESLNSTAIDVTKILSNDVTDSAWAAYLKGDRGVFTRRAVRLIEATEAREIARHYDDDAEFREQVNRYIHDFEAMLRRILADRDGTPLGVTMLSSDMGKLYVALAQAIDRIRK